MLGKGSHLCSLLYNPRHGFTMRVFCNSIAHTRLSRSEVDVPIYETIIKKRSRSLWLLDSILVFVYVV